VHFQDLFATANIGQRNDHLPVEAARAQQRRIQNVGTVGRRDDDHARLPFEAVHFDEQLVQGLFPFVVATAHPGTALAADGIDLIDKDDAWRMLLRLLEHVPHPGRTDADEHLDEVRAGNREERHFRFARDRLCKQGLAGTRRADHQHAFRDVATELLELRGVAQEIDEFRYLFLGLVAPATSANDSEFALSSSILASTCRTKTPRHAAALHLPHEEHPNADQQQHREPRHEDAHQEGLLLLRLARVHHDARADQIGHHPDVLNARRVHRDLPPFLRGSAHETSVYRRFGDAPSTSLLEKLGVLHRVGRHLPRVELVEYRHQHDANDHPDREILEEIIQLLSLKAQLGQRQIDPF